MERWLVCGGRDYDNICALNNVLLRLTDMRGFPSQVIHGAASGADTLAGHWARAGGIEVRAFPAEWHKHGPSAGPKRNKRMLDEGKPDLVIAFPGGRGTANMVAQAKDRGVEVIEVGGAE